MIYYIAFFVIIINGLYTHGKLNKYKKLELWFPFFVMLFIAGFRDSSVGIDTLLYDNNNAALTWSSIFESNFIYRLYAFVLLKLSHSFVFFHFLTAFVIYYSLMRFIKEFSNNPTLSYCFFIGLGHFFNSMNQHRQYLAFALCLWAIYYLFKKKSISGFILFSFLAFFTHNISWVLILVIVISYVVKKIKYRLLIVLLSIVVLSYIFITPMINSFVQIVPIYGRYLATWVNLYSGKTNYIAIFRIILLVIIELLFFKMLVKNNNLKSDKNIYYYSQNKYDSLLLISNFFNITSRLLTTKIYLLLRVALLFDPFLSILLPKLIEENCVFDKKATFVIKFIVCIVLLLNMYILLRSDGSGVMHYKLASF